MKKINVLLLTLFIFLFGTNVANAENTCSYKEKAALNKTAGLVKNNYEIIEKEETVEPSEFAEFTGPYTITTYSFDITLYNLTEDVFVEITNNYNSEVIKVSGSDIKDGKYTFHTDDIDNIIKYTFKIYGATENCGGTVLKSFNFTKPKFNIYSEYTACEDNESSVYCKRWITNELNVNESNFYSKIKLTPEKEEEKVKEENKVTKFLKDNYLYIIGGGALVGGTITAVVLIRKKRSSL